MENLERTTFRIVNREAHRLIAQDMNVRGEREENAVLVSSNIQ